MIKDGIISGSRPVRDDHSRSFIPGDNIRSDYSSGMSRRAGRCPCFPGKVFWAMLVLEVVLGMCLGFTGHKAFTILFGMCTWCISLTLHEFGHAITAYYGGDTSVAEKGYMDLDVTKYTTLVNSFLIPLVIFLIGGIGLPGGAVFIQTSSLRSRKWESFVSLAGPLATFSCCLLLSFPFMIMSGDYERRLEVGAEGNIGKFWDAMAFCSFIQMSAFFLNLIPLPPLDGFGALLPWLPQEWKDWYHEGSNANYLGMGGLFLVFMLFWRVQALFEFIITVTTLLGVPESLIRHGSSQFKILGF